MAKQTVVETGQGELLNVVGDSVRVLADSESSGGALFEFELVTPPGAGPPLHRHDREDEYFLVLEGSVKFAIEGRETVVQAGGFVLAPRRSVHTYVNVGAAPSRMLVVCTPGGLEAAFRATDRLGRAGKVDPAALAPIFRAAGVEFLGPPLSP